MTYEEFLKFVSAKCIHETLYEDTEGRPILVISMLDAYDMVDKAQRPWVGLTEQDMPSGEDPMFDHQYFIAGMVYAAKVLQEKNNG
jgi:hypothetical protein